MFNCPQRAGVLTQPVTVCRQGLWFCLPVSRPLTLHHLCLFPTSALLKPHRSKMTPVSLEAIWQKHINTWQIMLRGSTETVSCLGPCYMAQNQQRLRSHPHEPGHLTPPLPRSSLRIPAPYFPFTPLSIWAVLQDPDFLPVTISPQHMCTSHINNRMEGETPLCYI